MHVLAIHGGPGVQIPPAKLAQLRRALRCPVTTYAQIRTSLPSLIQELDEHVRRLGPVVLLGRSWGAALALQYVLAYPNRVAGVVLIALPTMHVSPARAAACAAAVPRLERRSPAALRAWESKSSPGPLTLEQRQRRAVVQARFCARRFFDMYKRLTPEALKKVRIPVLIVQGDQDHAAFARRITQQLPSARLVLVMGCDHSVPNEQEALLTGKFVQALC
jgi:pimeloyl-ACP methyl ester carboxylesterase